MKELKEFEEKCEFLKWELKSAKTYAKEACKHKEEDHEEAEAYFEMSKQELCHAQTLLKFMGKCVENNPEDVSIRVLYDWQHENYLDKVSVIRALHDLYRA